LNIYRKETGYNHVIIAKDPELVTKLSASGSLRQDALIKPVQDIDEKMYQLQFQKFPEGTVSWTETKYGDFSHFIQISENANHKAKYQKGKEWYDDTLFDFTPNSEVELEGSISHFELTDSANTVLDKYEKHTKRTEVKKLTINNTSPTKGQQTIKETIETDNDISLVFNENLKVFKNLKVAVSIPTLTGSQIPTEVNANSAKLTSNSVRDKQSQKLIINSDIETPPRSTVDISVVKDTLENVELPFRALMVVQGKAERMAADHSGIVKGPVPSELTMSALQKAGFKIEDIKTVQDSVLVWVTGTLKGSLVIGTGVNLSVK